MNLRNLLLFSTIVLLTAACAGTEVPARRSADFYLNEGESFAADKRYEDAIASWQKVKETYVSSEMNTLADLKIAEVQFLAENYAEAAAAYEDFLKQHPDHPQSQDILFKLGMAYYKQMLAPARDQTVTGNALATFQTLLKRYPDFAQKEEVTALIDSCRQNLAGHELAIGAFYVKTEHFQAAINRLRPLLENFPHFAKRDEVYFLLGKAYLQLGMRPQAVETFNTLYKQFPESEYILKGQKLLEKAF